MSQTPEFTLLLLLTHPEPEKQQNKINQFLTKNTINWTELLKDIKWHRVTPQAYDSLCSHPEFVPENIMEQLKKSCLQCKKRTLQQAVSLIKIAKLFDENKIRFITLKGLTLSQLLYSSITVRESHDIDIMIDFNDIERVEKILTDALGFTRTIPELSATKKQVQCLNKRYKDRTYLHPDDNVLLEVHWRFNNIKQCLAIPFSSQCSDASTIQVCNQSVPVLSNNYLWLYQSVHGSMSGWYRLHWINDIASMLVKNKTDWDALLQASNQYHCRRNLVESIMLAARLYQLPIPVQIQQAFQEDIKQVAQLKWASHAIRERKLPSMMANFRRQLFFTPAKVFWLYFLETLRMSPTDFQLFPLPDKLFFLYYWLRPVFRIIRAFKKTTGQTPSPLGGRRFQGWNR